MFYYFSNIIEAMTKRMNRAVAGYHMLLILSAVDGIFNGDEDEIITRYLAENFSGRENLDKELQIISALSQEDYPIHFNNAMNAFYLDSTPEQRIHFMDLAVQLVAADHHVTRKENLFVNELYNAWEAE